MFWYHAPMIDFFIESAIFVAIAIVAGLLGISLEAAELLAAFFALFLALWLGFRSARGMLAVVITAPLEKHLHDRHSQHH